MATRLWVKLEKAQVSLGRRERDKTQQLGLLVRPVVEFVPPAVVQHLSGELAFLCDLAAVAMIYNLCVGFRLTLRHFFSWIFLLGGLLGGNWD